MHKLKQEEFKDFQVLLHKFQDIQGLEFLFSNSRTFKDFQVLYENPASCLTILFYIHVKMKKKPRKNKPFLLQVFASVVQVPKLQCTTVCPQLFPTEV